jgi:hypothetical protein
MMELSLWTKCLRERLKPVFSCGESELIERVRQVCVVFMKSSSVLFEF